MPQANLQIEVSVAEDCLEAPITLQPDETEYEQRHTHRLRGPFHGR
jgi:hypothetical protein